VGAAKGGIAVPRVGPADPAGRGKGLPQEKRRSKPLPLCRPSMGAWKRSKKKENRRRWRRISAPKRARGGRDERCHSLSLQAKEAAKKEGGKGGYARRSPEPRARFFLSEKRKWEGRKGRRGRKRKEKNPPPTKEMGGKKREDEASLRRAVQSAKKPPKKLEQINPQMAGGGGGGKKGVRSVLSSSIPGCLQTKKKKERGATAPLFALSVGERGGGQKKRGGEGRHKVWCGSVPPSDQGRGRRAPPCPGPVKEKRESEKKKERRDDYHSQDLSAYCAKDKKGGKKVGPGWSSREKKKEKQKKKGGTLTAPEGNRHPAIY